MTEALTTSRAKRKLATFLELHGIEYERLTARTVHFDDLARGSGVFVTVHGWQPSWLSSKVQRYGTDNGFTVRFEMGGARSANDRGGET